MSGDKTAPTATMAVTTTQRSLRGLGAAVASYLTAFALRMAATLKFTGAATDVLTWLMCPLPWAPPRAACMCKRPCAGPAPNRKTRALPTCARRAKPLSTPRCPRRR